MFTDKGFSHALANIILEKDPTNEAALKMLQQPKNRAVVNGVTYNLDNVSKEGVARIWVEDVMSRLTPLAADGATPCDNCGTIGVHDCSEPDEHPAISPRR